MALSLIDQDTGKWAIVKKFKTRGTTREREEGQGKKHSHAFPAFPQSVWLAGFFKHTHRHTQCGKIYEEICSACNSFPFNSYMQVILNQALKTHLK